MVTPDLSTLRAAAPWLWEPSLQTCIVGSAALAEACRREGVAGPTPGDLDLSWALDLEAGKALLEQHDCFVATTEANQGRGTLAAKLCGTRIEITSFRTGDEAVLNATGLDASNLLLVDLSARDMTIGAAAWLLAEDQIVDPLGAMKDWRARRIAPVGSPNARILEHPARWLRYYRKAHALEFSLDASIRNVDLPTTTLDDAPKETHGAEFRAALMECVSPGKFFCELYEARLLQHLTPELSGQFDGRPAGPIRFHPEFSQGLHLTLVLEWAVAHTQHLSASERFAVRLAALVHDFGKSFTPAESHPSHTGHEQDGVPHVRKFFDRLHGLADQPSRTLALQVCQLHQLGRGLHELRPGTLAELYDSHFRAKDFPVHLFALALGADHGGRLGLESEGEAVAARVEKDLTILRDAAAGVDAGALKQRFGDDLTKFKAALHEARARAIRAAFADSA